MNGSAGPAYIFIGTFFFYWMPLPCRHGASAARHGPQRLVDVQALHRRSFWAHRNGLASPGMTGVWRRAFAGAPHDGDDL
jgi:hypothetical protein